MIDWLSTARDRGGQAPLVAVDWRACRMRLLLEFLVFGLKQARACIFAGSFLLLLMLSSHIQIAGLYRYDLLFLGAVAIQLLLLLGRLESLREVAVLSLFHVLGTGLELFKTAPTVASWSYPEPALLHIGTVPLYSGFMYAAIASYMMQAWRLFDLRLTRQPPSWLGLLLGALIYGNFFANHYIADQRWPLVIGVLALYGRCQVHFRVTNVERRMPLVLSFLLIGFFIWVAENIATYYGAWLYPAQLRHWAIVGPGKISSWALMVIISFLIVAGLQQRFRQGLRLPAPGSTMPALSRPDASPPDAAREQMP
jgi:uncharacterized membrane protein YoaT (DUF817 family)